MAANSYWRWLNNVICNQINVVITKLQPYICNQITIVTTKLKPCMWMTSEFINPANYSRWLWLLGGFSLFSVSSTVSNRLSSRRLELEAAVHIELKRSENYKIHVTLLSWMESMVVILSYKVTLLETYLFIIETKYLHH